MQAMNVAMYAPVASRPTPIARAAVERTDGVCTVRRTNRTPSGSHAATVGMGALSQVRKCPFRPYATPPSAAAGDDRPSPRSSAHMHRAATSSRSGA